jgi:hypothetical protein
MVRFHVMLPLLSFLLPRVVYWIVQPSKRRLPSADDACCLLDDCAGFQKTPADDALASAPNSCHPPPTLLLGMVEEAATSTAEVVLVIVVVVVIVAEKVPARVHRWTSFPRTILFVFSRCADVK